jgi:DNA-binding beta-propeller fold protein YncE
MKRLFPIIAIAIVLILSAVLGGITQVARAQSKPIELDYTSNNTDTNEITSKKPIQTYVFTGSAGDVISILMVRSSGNLRPLIGLLDFRQPKGKEEIAESGISKDGKLAGIIKFELPEDGEYVIAATREGVTKGTTTGKYVITLVAAGEEATPTRAARPTATKRSAKPTATPTEEEPTPEETEEATPEESNEAVQTFEVGSMPYGVFWNGNNLFVANSGDGTVSVLNGDGETVATAKLGGVPGWMAWDGKRLWVPDVGSTDEPGTKVNLLDGKGKKVGSFEVGSQPYSISYDKENKLMWVALYGDKKVVSVDAKGQIVTTVDTEFGPNTVLWTGDTLWVTLFGEFDNPNNQVMAIDVDGNVIGTFKVGKGPADLAWNPDDELVYVANQIDNNVMALNRDGKVVGTYKVGKGPIALLWDGEHLWASLSGENAVAAMTNKGKVLKKVPVTTGPNGLAFDGTYLWVANEGTTDEPGNTVTRIDVATVLSTQ